MIVTWKGKLCSDGCPFFELDIDVSTTIRFCNPQCRLSGHKDETDKVLDIRLKMTNEGPDRVTKRPKSCPFEDPHGIHVEVHNDEA